MTQIQAIKHQHALEHWKKVVLDQRASGLNATAYCRENNINYNAFYYWLRAIREDLVKQQPKETTPQFAALSDASTVPALTSNPSGLLLRYGPVSMEISENTSPELIRSTLRILREVMPSC